ncbi:hypothetical protein HOD29_06005 [archaeon]|jgi:hypothetical protein|nr:hypothetical protein [archaeon]
MINLGDILKEICEEISTIENEKIIPGIAEIPSGLGIGIEIPVGYVEPNSKVGKFIKEIYPIFSVGYSIKNEKVILNSLEKKYDSILKEIANRKEYNFSKKRRTSFTTLQ